MKNNLGIMQGRLSDHINNNIQAFPIYSWKKEFHIANKIGYDSIEWIFDIFEKNPIMDSDGILDIKKIIKDTGITVNSVCADFFMVRKLFSVSENELGENLKLLHKLINQCSKLEIDIIELPFVDSSSLKNENAKNEILSNLESILITAKDNNIKIGLETDLPPQDFKELILKFNHPNLMINYDIGNSTSNGFDTKLELEILHEWIINIHIKDRIKNGETIPLGKGNTNFDSFFSLLKKFDYSNDFIIQGAREDLFELEIKPEITCKKYFKFVKNYLDKYSF